ncbi:PAS domain S-box-containing protein [Flexibacter flexilis DSM 6793]|uniref:PAS domain S-box-containing protein n=1 Tax=Flexibacter flexilis DSM 6793 TaxID=927664 RepID=A0A1I1IV79_9BACT|nr:PAS domain S-box protein [Flexibacter flexilis]SFC39811.1 PAS domain S-box-containing protein [Flexibacter flexilis DSM 6793]
MKTHVNKHLNHENSDFITQQEHEANLRMFAGVAEQKLIRHLVNTVSDAMIIVNAAGIIHLLNQAAEAVFGYEPAELLGQKVGLLMCPKHAHTFDIYMRHYRITGQNHTSSLKKEVKCVRKNGRWFYVEFSLNEIPTADGVLFVVLIKDLTQIKDYEQQLRQHIEELNQSLAQLHSQAAMIRESEALMRGILDNADEAIIMTDSTGTIASFNVAAEEMFGYHRYNIIGKNVAMLFTQPTASNNLPERLRESVFSATHNIGREAVAVRYNGAQFPVFLSVNQTVSNKSSIFTGIIRDLTQQKKLEKETLSRTLLEQKNKEITDSLRYASQIQMAILPEKAILNKYIPNHFVFYRPKDIVSGDFYWFSRKNDKIFIAAIDCTGHGVPGAFMSLIGYTNLNKIVDEFGVNEPDIILASLDQYVTASLQKNNANSDFREGMDLALCCIDMRTHTLTYAGAYRPLYIHRQNGDVIEEINPTKISIGGNTEHIHKDFQAHQLQLQKGDRFYIFTDGITDQFGGKDSKKYTSRQFKSFLQSVQQIPMDAQGLTLETEFERWRNNQIQVDDVLVIGVQI